MSVVEALRKTALFSALSEPELTALALRASVHACQGGEILFSEGDPCSGLYIVAKGRVRIFKISPAGREQVLALEAPAALLPNCPCSTAGRIRPP